MQPSSVPRGRLVVAHPDRKAQRSLQRLVGATLCPVQIVGDADACVAAVDETAIVVIDAALAAAHPQLCERPARAWIAVPGDGTTPADTAQLTALLAAGWHHVVAHAMPLLAEELLATVQKLIRHDTFGVEKYMAWAAEVRSYTLDDASERDLAVSALASDVLAVGLPDRIGSLASVIADELMANAIYAAPMDDAGVRFRARDPRDRSRKLAGRDAVTLRWAADARYLAIAVRDLWGSLEVGAVGKRLSVAGRQPTREGEGMGLQLAYACCTQFIVNCKPNELTEIIALLDVRYRPTELGRSASFHAFAA